MTTILFLRHGPTLENVEERIQGQQPGTLLITETERFLAAVVPILRESVIEVVASSDLLRGYATRDILLKFLIGQTVQTLETPLLRERCLGQFEGQSWSEVPAFLREQHFKPSFDFRQYGGESSEDVRVRIERFLQLLASQYVDRHICCITHAGWMRQLVAMAGESGTLTRQWRERTVLAEAALSTDGRLSQLSPVPVEAHYNFYHGD